MKEFYARLYQAIIGSNVKCCFTSECICIRFAFWTGFVGFCSDYSANPYCYTNTYPHFIADSNTNPPTYCYSNTNSKPNTHTKTNQHPQTNRNSNPLTNTNPNPLTEPNTIALTYTKTSV
jgi:hypothetical protein